MSINEIHESLVNGQRRQMVEQIDEYGTYDFWERYDGWMKDLSFPLIDRHRYFVDATTSYFRIKNR